MAAWCSEVIEVVLSHLHDPLDLIACSVVSQGWYSAYKNARISSLNLSTARGRGGLREEHLYGLVRWVQAQQARGNLCLLRTLTIESDESDDDSHEKYFFSGAVLMLAGTWPLQDVEITGAFDFKMVLELLPSSVKHLKLFPWLSCFPDIVYLTSFTRLTALQTLTVSPVVDEDPPCHSGNCFFLDGPLANLTSMSLSRWPLILKDGCNITSCLPSLERAVCHVHTDLVNAFTSSDQFEELVLALVDPTPLPHNHSVNIDVKSTSKLKRLDLGSTSDTPLLTLLELHVAKPGVELLCNYVTLKFLTVASSVSYNNYENNRFDRLYDFG